MKRFVEQRERAILPLHRGEVYFGAADSSERHNRRRDPVYSRRWGARNLDISDDCNLLPRPEFSRQHTLQRESVSARLHGWKDAGTAGDVPRRAADTTGHTTAGAKASNSPDGVRAGAFHTCGK